jgi:hypothetical protein
MFGSNFGLLFARWSTPILCPAINLSALSVKEKFSYFILLSFNCLKIDSELTPL